MSTNGAYGFKIDAKEKIMYNHWDSYPEGLGVKIFNFVKEVDVPELRKIAKRLIPVDLDSQPTLDQQLICEACKTIDLSVDDRSMDNWYCLLRNTQGELSYYRDSPDHPLLQYFMDFSDFLSDCCCEWAYVINLDDNVFEVYKSNFSQDDDSRIPLVCSISLDDLPNMTEKDFLDLLIKD